MVIDRVSLESFPEPERLTVAAELPPDALMVERELWDRLHQAVESLPTPSCHVVKSVFFDDVSYAEAARTLGVSRQAAHAACRRGLHRLRAQMQCHDFFHANRD